MTTEHTVLLYSDDPVVRERMRLAIGPHPRKDMTIEFVDASTYDECVKLVDDYEIDLMVLDGEAAPAGGIGIARQLKDELTDPPPVCLYIARAADRWLAAYAKVESTLLHPLDPVTTGNVVAEMLSGHKAVTA